MAQDDRLLRFLTACARATAHWVLVDLLLLRSADNTVTRPIMTSSDTAAQQCMRDSSPRPSPALYRAVASHVPPHRCCVSARRKRHSPQSHTATGSRLLLPHSGCPRAAASEHLDTCSTNTNSVKSNGCWQSAVNSLEQRLLNGLSARLILCHGSVVPVGVVHRLCKYVRSV